jgi:hypothetical protein
MCHLFEFGLGWPGQILTGASRHEATSRQAKDETAVGRQARARLEGSDLCALRRFTTRMLCGSPRNPTLIIKPSPAVEVKQPEKTVMLSLATVLRVFSQPQVYQRGEALCLAATMIRYREVEK